MRRKYSITVLVCISLLFILVGGTPTRLGYHTNWTTELDHLSKMGIKHRLIDNETIELTDSWSGFRRVKCLSEPDMAAVNAWIQRDSIPLLEVDPSIIDTNQYAGWYNYWTSVPVSNAQYPILVGDIDHNGKPEVYGIYADSIFFDFESHIYEIDLSGNVTFRYKIVPRHGAALQFTDVDHNGLMEVMYQLGDSSFFHEQVAFDSLPTQRKFAHAKYESCGAVGTVETVMEMDDDGLLDFVYRGSDPDTDCVTYKTYVAEYNDSLDNFKKVWSTQLLPPESGIGGYDIGDYDGDGKMNFCASGLWGQIWVIETNGDNNYCVNWTDSLPFVNLVYQTSGDVDGDGTREFFVSATMSNGNWITVYEADSNDHYSPRFLFHLLSGGSLDEPTLLTNDVDGDGIPEFVILSGADLFIFKSGGNDSYHLWYYKHNNAKQSIQFYDFDGDNKKDFIITKERGTQNGGLYLYGDIFRADQVTSVKEPDGQFIIPREITLLQNYPNPFNPTTIIRYYLPQQTHVELVIYDIEGRKIETLLSQQESAGLHAVEWDANQYPTGMYLYRLSTNQNVFTKRMLLVK